MTTATAPPRTSTDPTRRTALVAGALYLVTFITSIPAALIFLPPVLDDPAYVLGPGADTSVVWGCLLDVLNALACVGTAVALFPVVKRWGEALALGFVTTRLFEAAVIMIGVVCLLAVVTLRQNLAGTPDAAGLVITANALVAVRDWTFVLGPSFVPVLNALLLGSLLYRSRLVPRIIPALGLVGAPLLLAGTVATLFGHVEPFSPISSLAALPVALWELSLGIWLVVKGFTPGPRRG
jgi:hypothetical protein